jgi:hypothetical protein
MRLSYQNKIGRGARVALLRLKHAGIRLKILACLPLNISVCAQTPNNLRARDRETGVVCGHTRYRHLMRGIDFAGQAKVTKLARHVFEHENVGRFQVSVHYLNPMQILHTLFASVSGRWQISVLH